MKQRTALTIAIALTAFVIIAAAGIVMAMPGLRPAEASAGSVDAASLPPQVVDPTNAPALLDTIQARDAAYQAQIEQANAQLKDAYEQIQQLQAANQQFMQREQIYQQRLEQSNQALQEMQAAPMIEARAWSDNEHESSEHEHDDD